jgi:hypothetical protein
MFNDDFADLAAPSAGSSAFDPGRVFKITLHRKRLHGMGESFWTALAEQSDDSAFAG